MTSSASPSRSRASSVEKASSTIGATSRWAFGKAGCAGSDRHEASTKTAAATAALFHILDLDGFARDALRQCGRHEPVEIAVEDVTRRGRGDAGAKVFDQL